MLREVRYPNVQVRIWEEHPGQYGLEDDESYGAGSPGAAHILERVCSALREGGVGDEEIESYSREATSRCYNHLLFTTMQWVQIRWGVSDVGTR